MEGRKRGFFERTGVDRRGLVGEVTNRGAISRWRATKRDFVKKVSVVIKRGNVRHREGSIRNMLTTPVKMHVHRFGFFRAD